MKTPYELSVSEYAEATAANQSIINSLNETLLSYGLADIDIPEDFGAIGEWLKEIQNIHYRQAYKDRNSELEEAEEDNGPEINFIDALKESVSKFGGISSKRLVLKDKRSGVTVSHRDVGVGISQVLPVLAALYGSTYKTILIEQPELHLHPALQAELGDACIESVKEGYNSLILETHSEHLILRIIKRIRKGTLSHEDVSIIYVDPEEGGSSLKTLRLDADGDFIDDWPHGFFAEREKELFE